MSIPLLSPTIDIRYKECFAWKQLPMEMNHVNIAFCTNHLDESLLKSGSFDGNISNCFTALKSKLILQHIVATMPFTCFVDIDSNQCLEAIHQSANENELSKNLICPKLKITEDDKKQLMQKLNRLLALKTCIFTFTDIQNEWNKQMFYTHMNLNYSNITHRLFVGKVENIPKSILGMCDFIFIEDTESINNYLQKMNHSLRITFSDFSTYVIDKKNYINSVVFSYDDVTEKLYESE
jgi:hypothetical protein